MSTDTVYQWKVSSFITFVRSCVSFSSVMRSFPILLLCVFLAACEVHGAVELRICAFNLHNFGESKAKNSNVMHTLTKVRHSLMDLACVSISSCLKVFVKVTQVIVFFLRQLDFFFFLLGNVKMFRFSSERLLQFWRSGLRVSCAQTSSWVLMKLMPRVHHRLETFLKSFSRCPNPVQLPQVNLQGAFFGSHSLHLNSSGFILIVATVDPCTFQFHMSQLH